MKLSSKFIIPAFAILFAGKAYSQNEISIVRSGKDKVVVYNPNNHAISVMTPDLRPLILAPMRGQEINFRLSKYHVEHGIFTSQYNEHCFTLDSLHCTYEANIQIGLVEKRKWWATFAATLLQGTNLQRIIDFIVMFYGNNTTMISEIITAYQSNDVYEQKLLRISKILENRDAMLKTIERNEEICINQARAELNTNKQVQAFKAVQFIQKQENFRLELTPYYVLGFNPSYYKGLQSERKSFAQLSAGHQLPIGCRLSFNFNAYTKYKKRKVDKKIYLVLDYYKSPILYKKAPTGPFKQDTAYAWDFYSAGAGWETLFRGKKGDYNSSLSFDLGLVTGQHIRYGLDSKTNITTRQRFSPFKEYNVYANLIIKRKIMKWVDFFAGYRLAFSFGKKQTTSLTREMPSFRHFQLGCNFNLKRNINYQY